MGSDGRGVENDQKLPLEFSVTTANTATAIYLLRSPTIYY